MGENDDFKVLCNGFRSAVAAVRRGALVDLGIYIARLPLHGCDSRTRRLRVCDVIELDMFWRTDQEIVTDL